tara:strand:- start:1534 stop:2076 length:543 start_codon:yes stop_codon:yes gene_type:complete
MAAPSKSEICDMTTTGKKDLFEAMQDLFNDPVANNFVVMSGNTEKNPKYYNINMKINGQENRHLCKVITAKSKSLSPFSIGDVVMSTEISNKHEMCNVSFSLVHEKVSEIVYMKGLFDQFGRLYKRTSWYDGYYTKSTEVTTPSTVMDKVPELEQEVARMKPFYEYGKKVLAITRPPTIE